MNVFEFLGLPWDHRPHPVMLVKHMHEVPVSKITFPVYGQVKRDGVFAMLVVRDDGQAAIFGRTGKAFVNVEVLASKLAKHVKPGVYMGELQTLCIAYLEQLSGVVNPERVNGLDNHQEQIKELLYIDFFDMLTLSTFIAGSATTTYLKRHAALVTRMAKVTELGLSNVLDNTPLHNVDEVEAYAKAHTDADREGAVFKLDCEYVAGHKGYRQYKIVRGLRVDLMCIGFEEGKGKYQGKVANLIFRWKGNKTIAAMLGRGWTHEQASQMYHDIKNGGDLNVIGSIFTVTALQESSKGKLRNVKCGERRHDKVQADY